METSPGHTPNVTAPRYDGHASWYEEWTHTTGAQVMTAADEVLAELIEPGHGMALDIGCGTGAHTAVVRDRGYRPIGIDNSPDQLRFAASRLPSIRADARTMPISDRAVSLAFSILTHTDLDRFDLLVGEALRALSPGGRFAYVGVHPCFVNPHLERYPTHTVQHRGYRDTGWQPTTAYIGDAVRHRVGVHHLTLEALLAAFIRPNAQLDHVIERGGDVVPQFIGIRLTKT